MDKKANIVTLKNYIKFLRKKNYKIKQVFLFGSYSKNRADEESDIDIAIVLKYLKNGYETLIKLMKYRRSFDMRIEPHVFVESEFNSENPYANEIMKTGVKLI